MGDGRNNILSRLRKEAEWRSASKHMRPAQGRVQSYLRKHAKFDPLHGDPRFAAVKDARTRLAIAAQRAVGGGKINPKVMGAILGVSAAGGLGLGAYLGTRKKKTAGMDFLKQDRPESVKKIYRALERDHPEMSAEKKARIAGRQGKKGKQKQGPPYTAPITKEAVSAPTVGKAALLAAGLIGGVGLGIHETRKKKAKKALNLEKAAHLSTALNNMWVTDPPPMPDEKTASAYFYDLRREAVDLGLFGSQFCKLANAFDQDTWDLAGDVEENLAAFEHLAKHGSGQAQELAQFYTAWADTMIDKHAFVGIAKAVGKGVRAAGQATKATKAGVGAAKKGVGAAATAVKQAPGKAVQGVRQGAQNIRSAGAQRVKDMRHQYRAAVKGPTRNQARRAAAQKETARRAKAGVQPGSVKNIPQPSAAAPAANAQQSALKQRLQAKHRPPATAPTGGPVSKQVFTGGEKAMGGLALGATGAGALAMQPGPQPRRY